MKRSNTYYVVRGIARALTLLVKASLVVGVMYGFVLLYWGAFYP